MWCTRHALSSIALCCMKNESKCNVFKVGVRLVSGGVKQAELETPYQGAEKIHSKVEHKTKLVKVALVGRPNVGKSTLINQIVGRTMSAVSMKAHTTRLKVKAFVNQGDTQIVFLDTPGLVCPDEVHKFKFETTFMRSAEEAVLEADILGVLHDVSYVRCNELHPQVVRILLSNQNKKSFLVMNKVDGRKNKSALLSTVKSLTSKLKYDISNFSKPSEQDMKMLTEKITSWPHFDEIFMISALEGDGVGDVMEYLINQAKPRPWLVQKNKDTINPYVLAVDLVKAACLDFLPGEVPYKIQCSLEYLEDLGDKCAVEVKVTTSNNRHARMVMAKIRPIAAYAESHMASALQKETCLRVTVN